MSSAEARLVSARRASKRGRSFGREDSFVRMLVSGWIGVVIGVLEEKIKEGLTEMRIFANV